MDAIRIARAKTGRDTIMKIFGSYHGHHDAVMVSLGDRRGRLDRRSRQPPQSLPYGAGIPDAVVHMTVAVPFNDAEAMERRIVALDAEGRKPACVIMEAAMMNLGIVLPEPGYLEAVREVTARHGMVLIFDEVKTGLCIAAGGATERWGVKPDMVTLAKALGGGLPVGAIGGERRGHGGRRERRRLPGRHVQRQPAGHGGGAREPLDVLTPEGYATLDHLNDRIISGTAAVIEKYNLPGYSVGVGSKGCVTFSSEKIIDFETFNDNQDARAHRPRLAVQHEPRHLHDAGPRGGMDPLGDAHRRGRRRLHRVLRRDGTRSDLVAASV